MDFKKRKNRNGKRKESGEKKTTQTGYKEVRMRRRKKEKKHYVDFSELSNTQ